MAFITDAYARMIVGWQIATHMRTDLVLDALEMAAWRRQPADGCVHHSDAGSVQVERVRTNVSRQRVTRIDGPGRCVR